MKLTLIGQEINELTLASGDAKRLLSELPKKISQSLLAEVCFLIPLENLPVTSCTQVNSIDKSKLTIWETKFRNLALETQQGAFDQGNWQDGVLSALQIDLGLTYWEWCAITQDQVLGWLVLGSSEDLRLNHSLDRSLNSALSLALKTAKLQLEVEKRNRYRLLRQKVTEVIHNSQDLETILHSAIAQTTQSFQATGGVVMMLRYAEPIFGNRQQISDPNIEVQLLTQWAQEATREIPLTAFPLTSSALCLKAWQQAPVPLTHEQISPTDYTPSLEPLQPMPAWLITPLMGTSSDRPESQMVLGFLVLQNAQPRVWHTEEEELASWVSMEASTAIIHTKTLQRVQSLVDERTAQLQRSLDVQAKLYETSRNQVEQLQELNQLKDEFLATISHELNTPLTTMKMAIRMLHNEQLSPERRQKYLGILEQEWNREHNLIKDLLTLQKIDEEMPLQVATVDLETLLTELVEEFNQKWQDRTLKVTLRFDLQRYQGQKLTIESDQESIRRIVFELLSNAGKYSRQDTTVEMVVSEPIENCLSICVKNIGYGISSAEQTYIFDRFRRGKGATQKAIPGTGLGLALVKSLVRHLRGKIDLDSEYNPDGVGETTFKVTLPRLFNEVSTPEKS